MTKEKLEFIKAVIKKLEKKGHIFYPCSDKELKEEWKDTANMDDKNTADFIEMNSIDQW